MMKTTKRRTLSLAGALFAASLSLLACDDDDNWRGRTVHSPTELKDTLNHNGSASIPSGTQLILHEHMTVQAGQTLLVSEGARIEGDGKLDVNGTLLVEGWADLDRVVVNNGAVIRNDGNLDVDNIDLNGGRLENAGMFTLDDLKVNGGSSVENAGSLTFENLTLNGGTFTNLGAVIVSDLTVNGGSRIDNGQPSFVGSPSFTVADRLLMNGGLIWNAANGTINLTHVTMNGGSEIDNSAGGVVTVHAMGSCNIQSGTVKNWQCP